MNITGLVCPNQGVRISEGLKDTFHPDSETTDYLSPATFCLKS